MLIEEIKLKALQIKAENFIVTVTCYYYKKAVTKIILPCVAPSTFH